MTRVDLIMAAVDDSPGMSWEFAAYAANSAWDTIERERGQSLATLTQDEAMSARIGIRDAYLAILTGLFLNLI